MSTQDNLHAAFAGESQANRKYMAFAKKAEADGYPQVARLFRAIAAAETIHAHAHMRALGEINDTIENLKTAMAGEAYEFQDMYPGFVKEAEKDGNRAALNSFRYAMAVEEVHHGLYSEAVQSVEAGNDLPQSDIYVCDVCGHTISGEAPDKCPVCGAPQKRFSKVE